MCVWKWGRGRGELETNGKPQKRQALGPRVQVLTATSRLRDLRLATYPWPRLSFHIHKMGRIVIPTRGEKIKEEKASQRVTQGLANYSLEAHASPQNTDVNEVSQDKSATPTQVFSPAALSYWAELGSCNRDAMASKAYLLSGQLRKKSANPWSDGL